MKVVEVMSGAIEFIGAHATVSEAAALMGELDVGALPVGSAQALEGVLTDRDILFRAVAAGLDPTRALVRDIQSTPVITCRETDELRTAMDLMAANHLRRLPVENDRGVVTGLVTLADVSRKLLVDSGTLQAALVGLTESEAEALASVSAGSAG